jgi:hypothetical protein
MKILKLTLKKVPFELMAEGHKKIEYRRPSRWIKSRVVGKEYDAVLFRNGYGFLSPWFMCEYKGYEVAEDDHVLTWPGLEVKVKKGDILIKLGEIFAAGNYKNF